MELTQFLSFIGLSNRNSQTVFKMLQKEAAKFKFPKDRPLFCGVLNECKAAWTNNYGKRISKGFKQFRRIQFLLRMQIAFSSHLLRCLVNTVYSNMSHTASWF